MKEISDAEFYQHATKVIVLADLHTGAYDTPKPQTFLGDGNQERQIPLGMSQLQAYGISHWNTMLQKHSDADVVLTLGDNVEGTDDQSKGYGCWTTNIDYQIEASATLYSFFSKARFIGVQGSKYHSGLNPSWDEQVLLKLKEKGAHVEFSKKDYGYYIDDVGFYMRHNIGYRSDKKNRANPLGGELLAFELNEKAIGEYRVLLFGHTHYFVYAGDDKRMACIVPGWKGRDAFVSHRSVNIPDCGYLVFYVLDDVYKWGKSIWRYPKEYLLDTGAYRKSGAGRNVSARMTVN
jgi:predicted phosphodiesterase